MGSETFVEIILAILLPPVGVFLRYGCGRLMDHQSGQETEPSKPSMGPEMFIQVILAIFVPPLGVFFRYALGVEFWICLVLTLLGYIPGIIYAIYVLVG